MRPSKPGSFLQFTLLLILSFAFFEIIPTSADDGTNLFSVNILALNDSLITPVLQARAEQWSKSSQVGISFKWVVGMNDLQDEMYESLNSNGDSMDGFLFRSSWLGNTYDSLQNLANSIQSEVFWDDVRSFVKVRTRLLTATIHYIFIFCFVCLVVS